ncbi:MAG TPA: hypothetical protein DD379_22640 [Cyanobacteria bacterium UBA11162]|nr:hypothetical protein [Cyanobacteria bacterium UBA11162]
MSSGHASHKGYSVKPNTNTNGQFFTPAGENVDPLEVLPEGEGYPFNAQGTVVNPAATERPEDEKDAEE